VPYIPLKVNIYKKYSIVISPLIEYPKFQTETLLAVANALGDLNENVVFVGGATLSLYATRQVSEVRPTDDVDIIIEVMNYTKGT
jgi:hypothetical protein